ARATLIVSLAFVTLGIGLGLLGVATLRTKTLDHWRGLPLVVGLLYPLLGITLGLLFYVPLSQGRFSWNSLNPVVHMLNIVVIVLLGLGWLILGTVLAVESEPQVAQPPSAMERSQVMFSQKTILWGGIAGVFGGLFRFMTVISPPGNGGATTALAL